IDNTKTRRLQSRRNTKNDRVPSTSKSSRSKNKDAKVEEHYKNLLLSKNTKHMSSAFNNIKLDSQNAISNVVCAMCKQCLISVNHDRLHLLHMDLCGPMRIAGINGKRYVLAIVDDYSRYTWVHFLRSKDEAPEVIKTFLKRIIVLLQSPVIIIRTDNGTEFKNQPEWSRHVTIVHQTKDLHTADYTQLYDFLKYNQKEVDELKAERLAKTQDPLALMANSNNPYAFPTPHQDQPSFNQNYLQQSMPNPEDIMDPTTAMNMALVLMAKAFKNSRVQNVRNQNGLIGVQGNRNQNQIGNGNFVAACAKINAAGQNGNQIRCYNYRGVEEYELMAAAADLDKIEEVNANCILMANLQQASTSSTQTDSAPVYDTDESAKVHENYDDNEIFNMFTKEEQYTELLEPILESHQVPQNDNDVISEDTSVERGREIVEQHLVNFEETHA
nr:Gag-Pol polyprotein [Tanacetum cinerariifolium]